MALIYMFELIFNALYYSSGGRMWGMSHSMPTGMVSNFGLITQGPMYVEYSMIDIEFS